MEIGALMGLLRALGKWHMGHPESKVVEERFPWTPTALCDARSRRCWRP